MIYGTGGRSHDEEVALMLRQRDNAIRALVTALWRIKRWHPPADICHAEAEKSLQIAQAHYADCDTMHPCE